jgi:hypothetical protein
VLHLRREYLVLQVSVIELHPLHERGHALRLGNVAGERLLAGNPGERPSAALDRIDDLFHILDARVVRAAEPDRVDR